MAIRLDPENPYPLPGGITDLEAMQYSAEVDAWLGLDLVRVEEAIHARVGISHLGAAQEYWVGLNIQSLLTPYTEITEILQRLELKPGDQLIDLGAGYGRIGFVMGHNYPESIFIGYEAVSERVIGSAAGIASIRLSASTNGSRRSQRPRI